MKKNSLNFLSRKSPSLFDTGVQIKHFENVELVLDSAAIPESGTAKVRSRPTVKHFSTSGDGALGFAVPTPKVPVLPPLNVPQNGNTGSTERLSNGMISVADPEEGEILIPAPPSMAPPPPPPQFIPPSPKYIPPPPNFYGNLDTPKNLTELQPPSMPPPKPPSLTGSTSEELALASIKPPPMPPPKPPSPTTSLRASVPLSSHINSAQDIPECPKFTPPLPPVEKAQSPLLNAQRTPPPKPARLSSIYSFELPPTTTPSTTPASSFNPQTTAKLYSVPKTTVLSNQTDKETRTQHILLLEDSSGNPVGVHINGKATSSVKEISPAPELVPPVKPVRRNSSGIQLEKDVQDLNETLLETESGRLINGEPAKVGMTQEVPNKTASSINGSPSSERALDVPSAQEMSQEKEQPASQSKTHSYSPLLNRKLQTLRGHEGSSGKDASTSPLALLMAAKNRDKQKSGVSRQSSSKSNSSAESLPVNIQETKPNSFTITPIPASSESIHTEPKLAISTELKPHSPKISRQEPSAVPQSLLSSSPMKHSKDATSTSPTGQKEDHEGSISFIPPPPEFANSDPEDEPPPNTPPPAPPTKSVDQPVNSSPITNGPTAAPKVMLSSTPTQNASDTEHKRKKGVLSKPQAPPGAPPIQPQTQTPPLAQTKNQLPAQPKFQFPAQTPAQIRTQLPAPPATQPPAPPATQPPAPPPTKYKTQIPVPPTVQIKTQTQAPPPSHPKTPIPVPPPVKNKTQTQTPPPSQPKTQISAQTPVSVSASQATLLSILQKKMLEMDSKFTPVPEADSTGDDWNSPLSDDDGATSSTTKNTTRPKSATLPMQTQGLDMKELETRVAKKAQDLAAKAPNSNGPNSKHQHGMTFTVRPGTKQPITPVIKTD